MSGYASHFSPRKFVLKCRRSLRSAGREVIEKALWMYFALEDENVPAWAKAVMVGALGYFIFPADTVPDVIPGVGFGDDLGVLAGALGAVTAFVGAREKKKAAAQLREWGVE